jgi:WD40 repeat protein
LSFLEAKAEAGLAYDLVRDYRLVEEYPGVPSSMLQNTAPFAAFAQRKAALFSARPYLVFQEAANQPAGSPVAAAAFDRQAAGALQRPWIEWVNRESTRAKVDFEKGAGTAWLGRLPLLTSPDDKKAWMIDREGRLVEVETATGQSRLVWETICPACQLLMMLPGQEGQRLVLLGIAGDWIVGNVLGVRPDYCTRLDLGGGRVAACHPCPEGILVIVTYPSHEPARLMLVEVDSHGRPLVGTTVTLEFGYKPRTGLMVLESQGLALCPYGPRMRECALIDYRRGIILTKYAGHQTFIEACCAVEEKDLLVTGAQDGELLMFRLSTREVIAKIDPGWQQVRAIVWSSKHRCLIAAGTASAREENYLVWNLDVGGSPKVSSFPSHEFNSLVLSAQERLVFSGSIEYDPFGGIGDSHSDRDSVIVRHIAELIPTAGQASENDLRLTHHNSVVLEIHPLLGQERAVTTSLFGEIWIWDLASGTPLIQRRPEAIGVIHGSVISDDGQWIAVASVKSTVEWEDGRPKVTDSRRVVTLWNLADDLIEPAWRMEGETGPSCPFEHDELIRTALSYFGRMVFEAGIGPYEATSSDRVRVFSADESGLHVREAASLQEVAWFEMPTRIAVVCAVDKNYALVGDAMGYVWILRLRDTTNVAESTDAIER